MSNVLELVPKIVHEQRKEVNPKGILTPVSLQRSQVYTVHCVQSPSAYQEQTKSRDIVALAIRSIVTPFVIC